MSALIELKQVSKRFEKRVDVTGRLLNLLGGNYRDQIVFAVDEVDLAIEPGEVVGLVGESGCGKSTLGRVIAGIHSASAGEVLFEGNSIDGLSGAERRRYTTNVQMIFQDPMSSLNPRKRVSDAIGEAPLNHGIIKRDQLESYVEETMHRVGLDPSYKRRLPHQFSGGQRQRIGIARALAVQPDFLVCDEAVAALDVSIQAQILNLFVDLREQLGLTYLFISHDLGVVHHLADRIVIMYLGRIVETAPNAELFDQPNHPYTQALLQDVPRLDRRQQEYQPIKGELPSPLDPPKGCHFHPRCPFATERCRTDRPILKEIAPARWSACHLNDD